MRKNCIVLIVVILFSVCILGVNAQTQAQGTGRNTDVIVLLREGKIQNGIKSLAKIKGVVSAEKFTSYESAYFSRLYKVVIDKEDVSKLNLVPEVEEIESVHQIDHSFSVITPAENGVTDDLLSNFQWALYNNGQQVIYENTDIDPEFIAGKKGFDIDIFSIMNQVDKLMKRDVVVAVLDSGLDLDHPDLKQNIFRNNKECDKDGNIRFMPSDDLDGNGYKGDCMGWDFTVAGDGGNRPLDNRGHGTHVAGIISAVGNNKIGVSGVSNRIKILPVKVMNNQESLQGSGLISFTDRISKGILYAVKMNADVINLSLGWPRAIDTRYIREAVKEALDKGITIVAAAGNNNTYVPLFPCSYQGVICVGASTIDGQVADFSNFGGHVDLLAPGDRILSAYPMKLHPLFSTTEGYEVKNGTSQAAPYVSASVAVLKGIESNISSDEIYARLVLTSKELTTEKNFIGGLLQLARSININSSVALFPVFKNVFSLSFSMKDNSFSIPMSFKNYWKAAKNVQIKIEIDPSKAVLDRSVYDFSFLQAGESFVLNLEGRIKEVSKDSRTAIKIEIMSDGKRLGVYNQLINFSRHLSDNDDDVVTHQLIYSGPLNDLVSERDGKLIPKFFTVTDRFKQYDFPHYYLTKKAQNGTELIIFIYENDQYIEKKIILPNVSRIMNVLRYDLNYDGVPDYLVRSGAKKDGQEFILYSYLDSDLKDLFPESLSHFSYIPPQMHVYLDVNQHGFVPQQMSFGKMAIPIWAFQGGIPEISRNPDPWEEENLLPARHIYYFSPSLEDRNGDYPTFSLRILDDYKLLAEIRSRLNLVWNDTIEIMGSLFQSLDDLERGIFRIHLSVGKSLLRDYFVVEVLDNLNWSIFPVHSDNMVFEGNLKVPVVGLNEKKVNYFYSTAFVGMQNDTLAQYVLLNPKSRSIDRYFRYEHARPRDHLVGVLASYLKDDKSYAFFQTKSNIVLALNENQTEVYYYPINRSSFIPGKIFNELYWPVVLKRGVGNVPAYYVDATELNTGHIYIITLDRSEDSKRLVSPMNMNIYISLNCYPMTPVRFGETESFSLVCKENDKIVMRYLPMAM